MTVSSTGNRIEYDGNTVTTVFAFPYRFLADDDLKVYVDGVGPLILNTDYTVTGAGADSGGEVTMTTAPGTGTSNVVILRDPAAVQELDLVENDPLPVEEVEKALDLLTMLVQRANDRIDRTVRINDASLADLELPELIPLTYWRNTADGLGIEFVDLSVGDSSVALAAALAAPVAGKGADLVAFLPPGAGAVPQTVTESLSERVSVRQFGAYGTGLSDDWSGIQKGIDAVNAAGGGILIFPPGVYLSNYPIHLKNNVTLDLRSGATIRRMFNSATPPGYDHAHAGLIATDTGYENVTILGGTLDGNGGVYDTSFVIMGGVGWENVYIQGTRFLDVVDFHALDIANANGVTVRDCKFLGFYNKAGTRQFSEAIQLDPNLAGGGSDNINVLVEGCYFGDNPDQPSVNFTAWATGVGNHAAVATKYSRRVTVVNNIFDGCSYSGVHPINWVDFDISNNRFYGCNNAVLLTLNTGVYPAEGCENGVIGSNTFNETGSTCVLWATPATPANITTGRHKNINITNNVAVCSSTGATTGGLASPNWTDGLVIHNNRVRNMDFGVNLRFCTSFSIVGNNIDTTDANGILVNESTETTYAGTGLTAHGFIAQNIMRRLGFRGIHINCAANDVFIIGNKITDPDTLAANRAGIQVDTGGTRCEIFDNSVTSTGAPSFAHGIIVQSVTVVTIKGNRSTGSTNSIQCTSTAAIVDMEGNNTPEGLVTAAAGSRYFRTNGGAVTTLYIKETGTGNTGWVAK
jgi:polygalacturonase